MKKFLAIFLSIVMSASVLFAVDISAFAAEYTYQVLTDGTIMLNKYSGTDTELVVPDTVDGYTVTKIGSQLYRGKNITSVYIPATITEIGENAFTSNKISSIAVSPDSTSFCAENNALYNADKTELIIYANNCGETSFAMPNTVEVIDKYAFYNSKLTSITLSNNLVHIMEDAFNDIPITEINLPDSVTTIDSYAFSYCRSLTTVWIGKGLATVGTNIFATCSGIREFIVSPENESFSVVDKALLCDNGTTLYRYPSQGIDDSFTVPDSVLTIKSYAFNFVAIKSVDLNNTEVCEDYAFFNTSSLSTIIMRENLTRARRINTSQNVEITVLNPECDFSFYVSSFVNYSFNIRSFDNSSVQRFADQNNTDKTVYNFIPIGTYNALTGEVEYDKDFVMPEVRPNKPDDSPSSDFSYTNINNTGVCITNYKGASTTVVIPEKINGLAVKEIGENAFYSKNINTLYIPSTVNKIGASAFANTLLSSINVNTKNRSFIVENNALYNYDRTELISYANGCNATSFTMPNTVEEINEFAFNYSKLSTINLSNSLKAIKDNAFYNSAITSVEIPNSVTSINDYAFRSCAKLESVIIGDSLASIGVGAFLSCKTISSFTVSPNNSSFKVVDKALIYNDTELVRIPSVNVEESYKVPDCVKTVRANAFDFCSVKNLDLNKVELCEDSIGNSSFKSIILPKSLTKAKKLSINATSSVTVLNPECDFSFNIKSFTYNITIYGYDNSTADELVKSNNASNVNYTFVSLGSYDKNTGVISNNQVQTQPDTKPTEPSTKPNETTQPSEQPPVNTQASTTQQASQKEADLSNQAISSNDATLSSQIAPQNNQDDNKPQHIITSCSHGASYRKCVTPATASNAGTHDIICSLCGAKIARESTDKIKSVALSKNTLTYSGKKLKKPSVTVKDNAGNIIDKSNYTVTYISRSNNKKVKSIKAVGQYKVKVELNGLYSGVRYLYFSVKPKSQKIKKLSSSKNTINVKWNRGKSVSGYQIVIATNKKCTKNAKTITIKKPKKTSISIKSLKRNTTYYVKLRSYKVIKVDGKSAKIYSSYSKPRAIKIK